MRIENVDGATLVLPKVFAVDRCYGAHQMVVSTLPVSYATTLLIVIHIFIVLLQSKLIENMYSMRFCHERIKEGANSSGLILLISPLISP